MLSESHRKIYLPLAIVDLWAPLPFLADPAPGRNPGHPQTILSIPLATASATLMPSTPAERMPPA